MKAVYKLSYMTIDGVGYFEPKEQMTYDEATEWAKTRGLRLLTRGEWCDLWDTKEEFRKSCQNTYYWTASVSPYYKTNVWVFNGDHGSININNRNILHTVRAVLAEPDGHHNY
jgi:hypothetical protein